MDSNIHHQTAILFNTPAYEDPEISDDRQVYIELQRFPYEERSNSVPFTYRPQGGEGFHKKRKRPKVNASNSPAMSTRSTSDTSSSGLRTPQQFTRTQHKIYVEQSTQTPNWDTPCNISQPTKYDGSILDNYESNGFNLDNIDSNTEDNFYIPKGYTMEEYNVMPTCNYQDMNEVFSKNLINNPVFGQPNVPNPVGRLVPMESPNSNDISNDLDMAEIFNHDWNEYIAHYLEDVPAVNDDGDFRPNLVSDSGRACPVKEDSTSSKDQSNDESVFFKGKEVQEVKKLIKEICDLKLQKPSDWDTEVRVKLDRLFDIRLSNGDTFLHMTLTSHLPSFEFVVNAVHSVNMGHLLDEDNRDELTVLHLAIAKHMPDTVAYLVEKGCDPMCADRDQNTAIHRAVTCKFCLTALLNAAKKKGSKCNLNQGNSEWQTPLHLAATHDCAESTRLLLEHGADTQLALDNSGRTPLHIAVQNDNKDVVATLLQFVPVREVDSVNCLGMTALQIACSGSVRQNTLEIIKLLLDKGASPTISERRNEPAYKMAKCYPKTWDIMKKYLSDYYIDDDSTDESDDDHSSDDSDDDFLSADEGLDDSEGPLDEVTTKLKNL